MTLAIPLTEATEGIAILGFAYALDYFIHEIAREEIFLIKY